MINSLLVVSAFARWHRIKRMLAVQRQVKAATKLKEKAAQAKTVKLGFQVSSKLLQQ